ncbi:xylulokinase [Aneurinibacillus terranovensis]|uniref:xylulokinase n=1 Tax=Aneurinibacillus terranovensis TaxID=278991 RepID=UPI00041A6EFA|nr:xylulokinase [Aneurinibacillus terranovensis]
MDTLLGIDLGTSSIKIILADRSGSVLCSTTKEYKLVTPNAGWAEQDPADWIQALHDGMNELFTCFPNEAGRVQGIGITGQMHGLVPVGLDGNPVCNAVLWADRRCEEEVRELESKIPLEKWMDTTGSRPNVSFTLPKILWMRRNQPDLFDRTAFFMLPKDFLRYYLTGIRATDETDASATLMYDIVNREWSQNILTAFTLDAERLPSVLSSSSQAGVLTDGPAKALGLSSGIPVICGAGDAEAQAIGNGIVRPNSWLCTIGTGGQIFTPVAQANTDRQGRIHTLCHGVSGMWHVMGATLSAGMSLQWLSRHILHMEGDGAYNELVDLVAHSRPGANGLIFLPYLFGERTPHMDDKAKGAFIGFNFHHMRKDMVRSVIEGVLFSLRECIDIMQEIGLPFPLSICMTGGAAESIGWRQLAADIFGVPVTRCTSRGGSAYGAIILTAVGIGWFPTVEAAADSWVTAIDTVYPDDTAHEAYRELYEIFRDAYKNLQGTFAKLDDAAKKSPRS